MKLSSNLILDMMMIICVAGAALRMPQAHFSWHAHYSVDLDKKVAETCFFLTFSRLIFRGARKVCENL